MDKALAIEELFLGIVVVLFSQMDQMLGRVDDLCHDIDATDEGVSLLGV